jgi:hypothetical protein
MKHFYVLALMMTFAVAGSAPAADHAQHKKPAARCAEASLACADKVAPFFDAKGTLWLVWTANGRVGVQSSIDMGRTFAPTVFVNAPEKLDTGPDSRPQIVVDGAGRATVTYTVLKDAHFSGKVMIARADNPAQSFAAPKPLTADNASQRFTAFALDSDGRVFAAWIDKRNLAAAKKGGKEYAGAALAFSWAEHDKDFVPAKIAADNSCECCRIGVTMAGPKKPVVIWRHIYDGVRDHAVTTFQDTTPGPVYRVAVDDWRIDACPHQGPSIAVGANGTYHATWFTDGKAHQGLFYGRSQDGGKTFSAPMAVGDSNKQPSRPYVLANGGAVWLVWKEFDGAQSTVNGMISRDDGATWSARKVLAHTAEDSDHPLLIAAKGQAYLSWMTQKEGYRLMQLEDMP